jgi:hypothetical protein
MRRWQTLKMKESKKLDIILSFISNKKDFIYSKEIFTELKSKIDSKEITPIINKLFLDGYIEKTIIEKENNSKISPPYYCRVTFSGRLFMEKGSYTNEQKKVKLNSAWIKTKIAVNFINGVIVLLLASLGVYLSWDTKTKSLIIDENKITIDSLNNELNKKKVVDNITWTKFKKAIEKNDTNYLIENFYDSIRCIDCIAGENEKNQLSKHIFNKHIDKLYKSELLKDREYTFYQTDSIIRVNYKFEKLIGNESYDIVYMFNKAKNKFLFSGMITVP